MTAPDLALALVRTTLATAAAACLTTILLRVLRINSPRTHRIAWLLVVLQGWLLIPWTFRIETPPAANVGGVSDADFAQIVAAVSDADFRTQSVLAPSPPQPTWLEAASILIPMFAVKAWRFGIIALALLAAYRYARIVSTLPLGAAPDDPQWQAQWQRELTKSGRHALVRVGMSLPRLLMPTRTRACHTDQVPTRPTVDFRITAALGPLVAFIPWHYLILAPRPLWTELAPRERAAILRHELAHIRRRDLWKSLAIRILALPQWFNPLVWLAVRRFDEAAEWSCDASAARGLAHGETTVAASLLKTAELTASSSPPRTLGFISAVPNANHRSALTRRIHRLVTPRFKEESTMRKLAVPLLLAAIAAAQLIRIEHVAASDPPSFSRDAESAERSASPAAESLPPDGPVEEVTRFTEQGAVTLSAAADAEAQLQEFAEIAKLPYVIEPPDILEIKIVVATEAPPNSTDTEDVGLRPGETNATRAWGPGEYLVAMDGCINLGDYGTVNVAGSTIEQAKAAVATAFSKEISNFRVSLRVIGFNSKVAYVIERRHGAGDEVLRAPVPYPLSAENNVGHYLRQISPRGYQLAEATITLHRPAPNGQGAESVLPIAWDATTDATAPETNYPILPGDRIVVVAPSTLPPDPPRTRFSGGVYSPPSEAQAIEQAHLVEEQVTGQRVQVSITGPDFNWADGYALRVSGREHDRLSDVLEILAPDFDIESVKIVRDVVQGAYQREKRVVLAGKWLADQQQVSAKTNWELLPGDRIEVKVSNVHMRNDSTAASGTGSTQQIQYEFAVLEDASGDLAEFVPACDPGAVLDSAAIQPALRVLEKHKLAKTLTSPKCVARLDEKVEFMVGEQIPKLNGETIEYTFRGIQIDLVGHRADGSRPEHTLAIDLDASVPHAGAKHQLHTGFSIPPGQTAIARLAGPHGAASPIYVVVTPEWIE